MRWAWVVVWCGLVVGSSWSAEPVAKSRVGYERPVGDRRQSRSVVMAARGMVATSQPLAVQVGLDVLRRGGNAADAAIAANAAMGVVEPMSCGIGGDLFVIYWDAKTERLYGLNGSGRSPFSLTREVFQQRNLKQIPTSGPLSWSVPGCVRGWEDLRSRFGTRPLAELLQPAMDYAERGFPVSEQIAANWKSGEKTLREWPDSARVYLPGGRAPTPGEVARLPELAQSLRLIARNGAQAFYDGPIAAEIDRFSRANGGYLTRRDLAEHRGEWVEPVGTNYRGYDVWELPPNGQGIAALQMLNVLEGYDVRSLGPGSAAFAHLFVEAKKLAFADRAKYYADPAFAKLPVDQLVSKAYADQQRRRIDLAKAAVDVPPGEPDMRHGDTIYLCVVDEHRNCCSLIQSLYNGFGSQVVPGNVGFALQNRGALFSLDERHLNRLEPHKRPFHTIIPALVTKNSRPWLAFGVMGGDMQPQGHVQVLVNMIDHGMNVQLAGDAARICHQGSATPTSQPMAKAGGTVLLEAGYDDAVRDELIRRGHQVNRAAGSYGGYQAIHIDWDTGTLHGGTDARKDGTAAGY